MLRIVAAAAELFRSVGVHAALSGIFGSVSLVAWICLLVGTAGPADRDRQWLTGSTAPPTDHQLQGQERRRLVYEVPPDLARR